MAINYGIPTLKPEWLIECKSKGGFVDIKPFIYEGYIKGKNDSFLLSEIMRKVEKESHGIFKKCVFFLHPSLEFKLDVMRLIIWSGEGKVVEHPSKEAFNIAEEEDATDLIKIGYHCYSKDLIFDSICTRSIDKGKYQFK